MTNIDQLKVDLPKISGRQKYILEPEENQIPITSIATIGMLLATLVVWVRDMMGTGGHDVPAVDKSKDEETLIIDPAPKRTDNNNKPDEVTEQTDADLFPDDADDILPLGALRSSLRNFDAFAEDDLNNDPATTVISPIEFTTPRDFGINQRTDGFFLATSDSGFQFPGGDNGGGGGSGGGGGDDPTSGDDTPGNDPEPQDMMKKNDDDEPDVDRTNDCRCGPNGGAYHVNRLPIITAAVVLGNLLTNQTYTFALADFLQNASDPDNDVLTIENLRASSGNLIANDDGTWTYTPAANDTLGVNFTFDVTDGEYSVQQTASLDLIPDSDQAITGTDTSGRIVGTLADDVIGAGGGDDTVLSLSGADIVRGGAGDDLIFGGDGNDQLFGNDGNDTIFGGGGNDLIFGGAGEDLLFGDEGNDVVRGEEGVDQISGGAGNDILDGGAGADLIDAGDGNDLVIGGTGDDIADGGAGADQFIATINDGNDVYSGGGGVDTYDLSETTTGAVVDLEQQTASSAQTGQDQIIDIENVIGSQANDVISGDDQVNLLSGGGGDDLIVSRGGDDIVNAGDGDDRIEAGQGADIVVAGAGDDVIIASVSDGDDSYFGGTGTDTYDLSATTSDARINLADQTAESDQIGFDLIYEFENVKGGDGDDVIIANESFNMLTGGDGNDTFVFQTIRDAFLSNMTRDQITDFEVGDKIDLSEIDADWGQVGEQVFDWLDNAPDLHEAGQLQFRFEVIDGDEVTIVSGNVDLDDDFEFEIEILGRYEFSQADFIGVG